MARGAFVSGIPASSFVSGAGASVRATVSHGCEKVLGVSFEHRSRLDSNLRSASITHTWFNEHQWSPLKLMVKFTEHQSNAKGIGRMRVGV